MWPKYQIDENAWKRRKMEVSERLKIIFINWRNQKREIFGDEFKILSKK